MTDLEVLSAERTQVNLELDAREEELRSNLELARNEADNQARRLLTERGAELVAIVASTLEAIGFQVQDMDEVWPRGD